MTNPNRNQSSKTLLSLTLVAAALLALGCSQAAASEPSDPGSTPTSESQTMKDIETLKKAEQVWVESLTSGDTKLLATIIDERFTFIGPDGQLEERDAYLAGYEEMSKLGVVVEGIDMSEVQFRVLDETGIVTGRVLARVKMQGQQITEDVRFTRVYRRTSSGWLMMAGQGTRITPPPPSEG